MIHIKKGLTVLASSALLLAMAGCGKQATGNHHQTSSASSQTSSNKTSSSTSTASSSTSTNDGQWHTGFPSVLQGTWDASPTTKGNYSGGAGETTINNDSITSQHRFPPVDPVDASGFQYKSTNGKDYVVKGANYTFNFHVYNNDKIYFSGTRGGSYGDGAIYYRNGNSTSNDSKSSSKSTAPVDNKTIGVLSELLVDPDDFKSSLGGLYYSEQENDNGTNKGYSYITANGDPTSYYYFKYANGNVYVKQLIPRDTVADGYWKTTTISLKRLLNDYYTNDDQKQEVQGYANQLKPESSYTRPH